MPSSNSTKAPAFQFYPKDFLSDEEQSLMSLAEAGCYIRLMSRCWLKGSLPNDLGELAKLCGATPGQMKKFWPAIAKCFRLRESDSRWIHPRLEKERRGQAERRRKSAENGALGGRPPKPRGFDQVSETKAKKSSSSPSASPSATAVEEQEISSEASASEPAVLTFATVGKGQSWALTARRLAEWRELYPGLDVEGECRKALAWTHAHPDRRKTAKGMPAFLVNWLNRAVDKPASPQRSVGGSSRTAGNFDAIQRFVDRGRTA